MKVIYKGLLGLLGLSLSIVCSAETLVISNVKMPKIPEVSRSAAIYLSFENNDSKDIILTGVSTPVAHHAMIHQSVEEQGVAKMKHQDSLTIPAQGRLEFSPGGYHIMLMGLDKKLMQKPFVVTLSFAKRDAIEITVKP